MPASSRISGFKDLSIEDRRKKAAEVTELPLELFEAFDLSTGLSSDKANSMVENVIGTMAIPVGIATNFLVDGRDVLIPMATEEPSVIAAASNAARMARPSGGFFTSTTGPLMIAQIQLVDVPNPSASRLRILEEAEAIIAEANSVDPMLVSLGGGAQHIEVREVDTRVGVHLVCHLIVDVRDAMGANAVNSMAEFIAPQLAALTGGRSLLRILSNKADQRLVRVRAVFSSDLFGGAEVARDIELASALAESDPYRAATHNKGIMNGISATVLATGNDTRAVEAGCHSHAVQPDGRYGSLSRFEADDNGDVVGTIELPLPVGLVGGATKAHPSAQAAVKLLGVSSATELASVIGAVGLAQNFAACRALASEGIQRGHMSLHARMLATSAGAEGTDVQKVADYLIKNKTINLEAAHKALAEIGTL